MARPVCESWQYASDDLYRQNTSEIQKLNLLRQCESGSISQHTVRARVKRQKHVLEGTEGDVKSRFELARALIGEDAMIDPLAAGHRNIHCRLAVEPFTAGAVGIVFLRTILL